MLEEAESQMYTSTQIPADLQDQLLPQIPTGRLEHSRIWQGLRQCNQPSCSLRQVSWWADRMKTLIGRQPKKWAHVAQVFMTLFSYLYSEFSLLINIFPKFALCLHSDLEFLSHSSFYLICVRTVSSDLLSPNEFFKKNFSWVVADTAMAFPFPFI